MEETLGARLAEMSTKKMAAFLAALVAVGEVLILLIFFL